MIDKDIEEVKIIMSDNKDEAQASLEDRATKLSSHLDQTEAHLTLQIDKTNREIERMKFELQDNLDQKHQIMQRQFVDELSHVRSKFDNAIALVTEASKNLGGLFQGKMTKMKDRIMKFFAEIRLTTESCEKSVYELSQALEKQRDMVNANQKYDAQLFSIKSQQQAADR